MFLSAYGSSITYLKLVDKNDWNLCVRIVVSVVEMAKANELNIYKYLAYLLEHRSNADMSDEQLEELTPWAAEVQAASKN